MKASTQPSFIPSCRCGIHPRPVELFSAKEAAILAVGLIEEAADMTVDLFTMALTLGTMRHTPPRKIIKRRRPRRRY